ncbi:MAG: TetR/AcrR family transcriptional regulator [Nitrososphaerota archaeon]|jgi:AcrR family transcriptional regulator|nr:TetR/AcrR family transcriptional regulator [Nitrososphaerota archaeon]
MNHIEQDLRQKIIDTTKTLLDEVEDIEKITIRQIAKRANVGIGLINYHFKSKNNLLSMAIGDVMKQTITKFTKNDNYYYMEPVAKLKTLLKELCELVRNNEKLTHFMMLQEITQGSMQAPLYIVPLLREIFGEQNNDIQLRIAALQIIQPIQISGLNTDAFYMYSGIDMTNSEQRNRFIDTLIDNLLLNQKER